MAKDRPALSDAYENLEKKRWIDTGVNLSSPCCKAW